MLVTDAQIHLWELERPDRPWPKDGRSTPHLPNGFTAEQMLAEMDAIGVDRAVIVPPSWIGETNAYALEASEKYPNRFAVMGRFDPEDQAFLDQLPTWLDQSHMLGIRITFNTPHFVAGLDEGIFEPLFTGCNEYKIPLMALFSGPLLAKVPPIVEKNPNLPLIIDHMGALTRVQGPESFASIDLLLALAKYPNVYVKTTSAPSNSAESFPYRDVQPFLKQMYDAFGPQRLMWGSDITRLKGTYGECLRLFRDELDFLSADDKEWILGKSLATALNWPE
ncbi:MAG: amidohydrolase family protein [Chloroflexota bacterium]